MPWSNREYYAANREKLKAYRREHYAANREREKAYALAYYYNNVQKRIEYNKTYKDANPEKYAAYMREYREANKELHAQYDRAYRQAHLAEYTARMEEYRAANRDKMTLYTANRRARQTGASPAWLTDKQRKDMERIYFRAQALTCKHSTIFTVDHIIPLNSKQVCGLHIPSNLRVITMEANSQKRNRLPPDELLIDYSAPGWRGV